MLSRIKFLNIEKINEDIKDLRIILDIHLNINAHRFLILLNLENIFLKVLNYN